MDVKWFKSRLKEVGKTQLQLSSFLNIEPSAVTRILKGSRSLKNEEAVKVAIFLKIPLITVMEKTGIDSNALALLSGESSSSASLAEEAASFGDRSKSPDISYFKVPEVQLDTSQGVIEETESFPQTSRQVNFPGICGKKTMDWLLPAKFVEEKFQTLDISNNLILVKVVSDEMAPNLQPGDRLLIDLADQRVSPPGIFLLWDGVGYIIRRLSTKPLDGQNASQHVELSTDNPIYDNYSMQADQLIVLGRVKHKIS